MYLLQREAPARACHAYLLPAIFFAEMRMLQGGVKAPPALSLRSRRAA